MTNFTHIMKRAASQAIFIADKVSQELLKNLKATPEEELHVVFSKILCLSQFFKIENVEQDFHSFLEQINQKFFREDQLLLSSLMAELRPKF